MEPEIQVSTDAETQNPAAEAVEPAEEVVAVEEKQETPETEESKALKRLQRRIDKRTADVYRERAEKEQLAQRLAQFESKEERAEPSIEEVVRHQAREIARMERLNDRCNEIATQGAKEFPDFKESLQSLGQEAPLFDQRGAPTAIMQVILEADNPAKLMHHLGKNPDLAADLVDLSPTQLARKLDRLERDMGKAQKSSAPAPLTPTKGAASNDDLHPGLSDQEWINRREKQLREARR